jgi:hypothetical protein
VCVCVCVCVCVYVCMHVYTSALETSSDSEPWVFAMIIADVS